MQLIFDKTPEDKRRRETFAKIGKMQADKHHKKLLKQKTAKIPCAKSKST